MKLKCKLSKKDLISIFGIAFLIGYGILMYVTFLIAFFTDYEIIFINIMGEAYLEIVLIPITLALGIYGIFHLKKPLTKNI